MQSIESRPISSANPFHEIDILKGMGSFIFRERDVKQNFGFVLNRSAVFLKSLRFRAGRDIYEILNQKTPG